LKFKVFYKGGTRVNVQTDRLNTFLVSVFNNILRLEEENLHKVCKNLSVTELHVLDAVHWLGNGACMADIAARLHVTAGTLTASVKTLEQKGYLIRKRSENDKRRVVAVLTERCAPVLYAHSSFHKNLCGDAVKNLSQHEISVLGDALQNLHAYFSKL
jgi:DNA-binding MarR family transcriptional regulator